MADDLRKRGPQDGARVNVNEDYELAYWTKKFNCSADQLKAAVDSVGVSADKIEAYMARRKR